MTYVEMTDADDLVPADLVQGLTLEPVEHGAQLISRTLARIGTPHGWRSASRSGQEWTAWFAQYPDRKFWLVSFKGEPAGMLTCDLHPAGETEIVTFGLVPEFIGKGLGGFALTLCVRQAWALNPAASRVWLHTSSFDHPNALRNYHRRGFRTFKTEQRERD